MTHFRIVVFCFLFPVLIHSETTVDFRSFVQSGYTHRDPLPGTRVTADALRQTLRHLPAVQVRTSQRTDESPEQLKTFLQSLPDEKQTDFSFVYIAGHQSAGGEYEFTGKQKMLWSRLLEGVEIVPHPRRITVLDVCYAEAAGLTSEFAAKLGPVIVFSSEAGEKAYELELTTRRPVDYARRFPGEMGWLKKECGPAPLRYISFFGLMWTAAFLEKPPSSFSKEEWASFLSRVRSAAESFRRERSEKLSSTILIRGF